MSTDTLTDLRQIMFQTLRGLQDKEKPLDLESAKAITDTAQVIINSAKVEVDYIKATGAKDSGFITPALPAPGAPADVVPRAGTLANQLAAATTSHRLKG